MVSEEDYDECSTPRHQLIDMSKLSAEIQDSVSAQCDQEPVS
jgi:hypothetical protein